jgi:hypothetical protein
MLADRKRIEQIIQSNNTIKKSALTLTKEFLGVQADFFNQVNTVYQHLGTIEHVANIFLDEKKKTILNEFHPLEQVQIVVCGYNSVGKTSFIHELLGCGEFLPVDKGPVTALIVKFSYAPADAACLLRYASVEHQNEIENRIDLSSCFNGDGTIKARNKLRKEVKGELKRTKDVDPSSDEFVQWAKRFIEIRLPSKCLEPGLHVYDTPGFLGSDVSILRANLLALVHRVHPIIVFLYDNPAGSDDSRKCYNELKLALRSQDLGVDVFFLNTKVDVAVIRKDARSKNNNDNGDDDNGDDDNDDDDNGDDDNGDDDNGDDDDEKLIEKERLHCYNLLMKIDEMKGDVHERKPDGTTPSIFSPAYRQLMQWNKQSKLIVSIESSDSPPNTIYD